MSSTQVNTENKNDTSSSNINENTNNNETTENQKRFEGKVSAEQEISATVARKRRNISKKRSESAHRARDVTPARDLLPDTDVAENLPKTPERKLKKTSSNNSSSSGNSANTSNEQKEQKGSPPKLDNETKTQVQDLPTTQNLNKSSKEVLKKTEGSLAVDQPAPKNVSDENSAKKPPVKISKKVDAKIGPESLKNATQVLEKPPDTKMEDIKKENMKTAAKIMEKVKKSEGVQTPHGSVDVKEGTASLEMTESTKVTDAKTKESPNEEEIKTDFAEKGETTFSTESSIKAAEIDKGDTKASETPEISIKFPANNIKVPENEPEPSEEIKKVVSPPPRGKPARMKRDKLIKKRSQSQPRPTTEEEDEMGSRLDLEVQKERLKKEQLVELPKSPRIPKPIRKDKQIIPISPESVLGPSSRDLVEDFKQAQVLSAKLEVCFKPSSSESSVESSETSTSQNGTVRRRVGVGKPYAPAAQQYLERRRLEKQLSASKEEEEKGLEASKKKRLTLKQVKEQWKQFKLDHQEECFKIRNLRNRCLNEIGLLMIMCGLGGLIFKYTEGALENFYKCGVKRVKRDFIDLLWIRSHNLREEDWKALARVRLRDFEEQLHTAHEAGVQSYSGQRSWSFLNGIVYALTIVTTIGKFCYKGHNNHGIL